MLHLVDLLNTAPLPNLRAIFIMTLVELESYRILGWYQKASGEQIFGWRGLHHGLLVDEFLSYSNGTFGWQDITSSRWIWIKVVRVYTCTSVTLSLLIIVFVLTLERVSLTYYHRLPLWLRWQEIGGRVDLAVNKRLTDGALLVAFWTSFLQFSFQEKLLINKGHIVCFSMIILSCTLIFS